MYRKITTIFTIVLTLMVLVTPAEAITFGEPDGNRHPSVGLTLTDTGEDTLLVGCSGTLIAPTVFLTAGHCTRFFTQLGPEKTWITFDSSYDPLTSEMIPAAGIATHPSYNFNTGDNDVGVILLAEPVEGIVPSMLPSENLLDKLKASGKLKGQTFINVGYGATADFKGNPPTLLRDGLRRFSISPYISLTQNWLLLSSNNDATGMGGICFGDSGGPHFLGDSSVIVSISSLGDAVCRALDQSQRVDLPSVRAFLANYVTLP